MIDETFLTTEEVLEYLQVNLRTVYRLIKAGKIPAVRVGRQWRFRKRDIDAWLDSQRPARRARTRPRPPRPRPARARQRPTARPRRRRRGEHPRPAGEDAGPRRVRRRRRRPTAAPRSSACALYPYDLLIADLKMPGMDGLTVIREAKRYKADLPVIIITGFSTESSAIEAVNLGVAGYLTKPFRVPQVLGRRREGARRVTAVRCMIQLSDAHQVLRRSRPARPRHLADHRPRARRPVRSERRRQDHAAPDDGRPRRARLGRRPEAVRR